MKAQVLTGKIIKKTKKSIQIEIAKDDFESFCDSIGLYQKKFLKELDASGRDHRMGRTTKRNSLTELID